ncbi:MAG: acyl-CoA dehydratase activase [Candidatus Baldrarchaeia archaeon]
MSVYVAGIDVGAATAKCVIMDDGEIVGYEIIPVSYDLSESAKRVFNATLKKLGISADEIKSVVSTGYGRYNVPFAKKQVTEISCHGRGAIFLIPSTRTIIDIGGQDTKVIAINERGRVLDFVMNDKCAAGTGRFLEVMARVLDVKVEEMGEIALRAKKKVKISSTCTVFAESEVINHLVHKVPREDIIAGLVDAISSRVAALAQRVTIRPDVILTGGVAKNEAVRRSLSEKLGLEILRPKEPQIVGAIGAALFARDILQGKR